MTELENLKTESEIALKFLLDTDYLVIQQVELGNDVSLEMRELRAEARKKIRAYKAYLLNPTPEQINE